MCVIILMLCSSQTSAVLKPPIDKEKGCLHCEELARRMHAVTAKEIEARIAVDACDT